MINCLSTGLSPRVFIPALDQRTIRGMAPLATAADTRRKNLQSLIAQFETAAAAAAALDMSPSQLAQIAGPHPSRNIGPHQARKIEARLGKPKGWLDTPQGAPPSDPELQSLTERMLRAVNGHRLPPEQISTIKGVIEMALRMERGSYTIEDEDKAPDPKAYC